jgi:hypothetical protein
MARKAKKTVRVTDADLEAILIECALAVGQGVGAAVKISHAARKYWHADFKASIKRALQQGENWAKGRKIVVPLATKMGGHAATMATAGVIMKTAAKKAADTIKTDKACPAGLGKFCS